MSPTRPRQPFRYFSLFSGIGGFELGIQNASSTKRLQQRGNNKGLPDVGHSSLASESFCIGFSEIDKYATQIYKTHFNHKEYGDVSTINWSDTEDFNLLVGGFPCQAFSIAGKRQGFCDTRGTLFFEIARCIQEKQPRLFLLENVKGLLSHDKGKTFGVILNTLDELGYDLQWQVLNSKNFGVPQNRERVFIVGHLRGTRRPEVFPIRESGRILTKGTGSRQNGVSSTLTKNYHKGVHGCGETYIIRDGRDNRSCLRAGRVLELGVPGSSIRRLTPTECERLQGFPDGWTEGISNTQRYKCLGNAVTVNVIEAIMIRLLEEK